MPTVIRIQELSEEAEVFRATVSFNSMAPYAIMVRNPFSEEQEKVLEWYFEEHLNFPYTKEVQARQAATSIRTYGETLFRQVFQDNSGVIFPYKTAVQGGLPQVQIEIAGSPKFHALHWEALADPELPLPLAVQATMVRLNSKPQAVPIRTPESPTIRLLIVTARPLGQRDVGYRTISRPLVETLRNAQVPVQIDILRPGTYKALENHLREATSRHGVGYYHVIHFDMHGSLLTYEELEKLRSQLQTASELPVLSRHLFQDDYALKDIQAYAGTRAFLFFEGEQDKPATAVEAASLADMLLEHQVPIVILNACQSGKQVGERETSLGSRLMQAGVQLVLAMGYSVTVTAAALLMKTLYTRLFDRQSLSLAICNGRRELYNQKQRQSAYFGQMIDLEDWLLPVVYQNAVPILPIREFKPEESSAYYERLAAWEQHAPPEPMYGFVGRDLDILQVEKRLLTKRNLLLVRGMGGAGKTTLLRHLESWWYTTGLVQESFYFGYDTKAWTRQQIMVEIAQRLLGPVAFVRDFQPLSLEAQQVLLARRLRVENHLLILDNLESITGTAMAVLNTLPANEQRDVRRFLVALAGGRTLVLLGSRNSEAWLAQGTFEDNEHDLSGLDPEAASLLADSILAKHSITKYRRDGDLQHLLTLLDGFPLALEVVLPNLTRQTPSEVLTALQSGDVELDKGSPAEKTKSLLRCIDYSHSSLSTEAQQLLLCLAPYTSVFDTGLLENYTEHLQQEPTLTTLPFERWSQVLQEAINWGLLMPDPDFPSDLHLQPIFPYFLRTRLGSPAATERRNAIEIAFRKHYAEVGNTLDNLLTSKDPKEWQIGQFLTRQEYENLMAALNLALTAQESITGLYNALLEYLDSTKQWQQSLELFQGVEKRFVLYPAEKLAGPLGVELVSVIHTIGNSQFELKQYEAAKASYQKVLERVEQLDNVDEKEKSRIKAIANHQLGMAAQEQRHWEQAEQYYQQALQLKGKNDDRYGQAATYHQLGVVAKNQEHWEQAEQYHHQALQILGEHNDRYNQATTYHDLGVVTQRQQHWERAEQYYQQALHIYNQYNDRYEQAKSYHQLGVVAQEQEQWEQAEQYYQQALQIYIEYNDRYGQANTYHNLGLLAQEQGQWEQARDYLLQALEIYVGYEDVHTSEIALRNLARLWRVSGDVGIPDMVGERLGMGEGEGEQLLRKALGEDAP